MYTELHLIERKGRITTVDARACTYESGEWAIPLARAKQFIGRRIYLHRGQDKPSFFGGVITGCRVVAEGEWAGRVIFRFTADTACKGVVSRGGWANEKKYV